MKRFFERLSFDRVDRTVINVLGFDLNVLNSDLFLTKVITFWVAVSLAAWALMGWDSSITQVEYFLENVPRYLAKEIGWDRLVHYYLDDYGKGMKVSAFAIYGAQFCILSGWLRAKHGIVNSYNLALAGGLVAFTIAVFESTWHVSYYIFQNQRWILDLRMPQLRILLQNDVVFGLYGLLAIYILSRNYRSNTGGYTKIFFCSALLSMICWWSYGTFFPVKPLSVNVQGFGTWTNSVYFPQTVYTVDTDLLDGLSGGEQFFVEDNLVHLVNVLAKVSQALFFSQLFKVKKKE